MCVQNFHHLTGHYHAGGNLFAAISIGYDRRVYRIAADSRIVSTYAGGGPGFADNVLATETSLEEPRGLALDPGGNLYIADRLAHRVRRVDAASRIITTVAGGGSSTAENVPATDAFLCPVSVAVDGAARVRRCPSPRSRPTASACPGPTNVTSALSTRKGRVPRLRRFRPARRDEAEGGKAPAVQQAMGRASKVRAWPTETRCVECPRRVDSGTAS
jgi:hypothetical protein